MKCACMLALGLAAVLWNPAHADDNHRFGFIGHSLSRGGEKQLRQALKDSSEPSLSFVVIAGIKGDKEGCTDRLYEERRDLIDEARRPIMVALAGSDWTECKNSAGKSNAIERLNRMRELYFGEPASLGEKKLAVTRQSTSPRFRSYAENSHWNIGKVLYATLNLPAANNHFRPEAGRNNEFEDRLVANRFWLNRLFSLARTEQCEAIVLFSEGDAKTTLDPVGTRALRRDAALRDGFAETRKQIVTLAQKYKGKVLLVDSAPHAKATPAIEWRGNLGHVSIENGAIEVAVRPGAKQLFTLQDAAD
ncbi:MAG: hypothetical protein M3Y65_00760 [Pseudomonadota bacterium]|nr:hypothetical protein [Pseudomonadota bacterium]